MNTNQSQLPVLDEQELTNVSGDKKHNRAPVLLLICLKIPSSSKLRKELEWFNFKLKVYVNLTLSMNIVLFNVWPSV